MDGGAHAARFCVAWTLLAILLSNAISISENMSFAVAILAARIVYKYFPLMFILIFYNNHKVVLPVVTHVFS
ncbi:hypothetical protein [Stenotrophobium rhamnosiphilum]|uniref:hypothetical protein n=1 Tax=Stenotrophobium rhamnosiphilum TaxID=2029166 RepID=UPI0011B23BBF|nr:hypothetical protein [Stenotrophobium rhamnosiphilum]